MTSQPPYSGVSLLQRLSEIAHKKANADAIVFLPEGDVTRSESCTYYELQQQAYAVATVLRERAQPGDRVVLLLPAGLDYFACAWACLLAEMVVVPMAVPQQQVQFEFSKRIIENSGASILITQSSFKEHLEPLSQIVNWMFVEDASGVERYEEWSHSPGHSPALLQYTSGSTGMPKGVVVTHDNLAASMDLMMSVADINDQSTLVSWLPLFHNMGFISFGLLPLCVGARLVLMPTERFMENPARWFLTMSHFKGTHSGAPNIGYESCLNFLPDALLEKLNLSAWRVAAIGSEPLKASLIKGFVDRFSRCGFKSETFLTTYGFSEATVFSSGADSAEQIVTLDVDKTQFENGCIKLVQSDAKTLVSVGVARPHVAIVNPESRAVCNEQELGEIWINGPTVAAGYWNNPEATAHTFDQYASDGSGPYVRSGDIGMIAKGCLYVVGRSKELIIINGKKLHPLDIEQSVNAIHQACVPYAAAACAWDQDDNESLALFQEIKPNTDSEQLASIAEQLNHRVYEHFGVPVARLVLLAMGSLPRTQNGKLQRLRCIALLEQGQLHSQVLLDSQAQSTDLHAKAKVVYPTTLTQTRLHKIWCLLLNKPVISVDADFIGVGGQSIVAARLIGQVREVFGVHVTLRDLFQHSTIELLAQRIDSLKASGAHSYSGVEESAGQIDIASQNGWLPLTSAQKQLWLHHQIDGQSAIYHMSAAYELTPIAQNPETQNVSESGASQIEALQRALQKALNQLVSRHPILHTVYRLNQQGEAQQRPLDQFQLHLECHDAGHVTESVEYCCEALLRASRETPFDLTKDLPIRACLIKVNDRYTLGLTVHHIAADGWSVGILVRELEELYESNLNAEFETISEPIINTEPTAPLYAQWVLSDERHQTAQQQASLEYWQQQLRNLAPIHHLPLDGARSAETHYQGASSFLEINNQLMAMLDQSARENGVTLFMQLQTALAVLMARLSNETDVAVGAAYANRNNPESQDIVGFFVNSLVIRHQLEPKQSLGGLLERSRDLLLDAYDHNVPFDQLVESLNPVRVGQHNPLFQVMLNLQNKDNWNLNLKGWDVHPIQIPTQEAKFDLVLDCTQHKEGLSVQWEYNTQLFCQDTIERWQGYFKNILNALWETPDLGWDQVDLLSEAEHNRLLHDFNQTQSQQKNACLHQLFEQQAQTNPNNIALVANGAAYNYQQVNQRANRIAHCLIAQGVGPDTLVGVLIERSIDSVMAMLAILKAGGAYLPIDVAYPQARIEFILHDANPAVVIVSNDIAGNVNHLEWLERENELFSVCTLQQLESDAGQYPKAELNPDLSTVESHHLAYAIYTSGSTGQPKGVLIEHQQVVNLVANDPWVPITQKDCVAHCANVCFDAATWEVWSALTTGAKLFVVAPDVVLTPDVFSAQLQKHKVSAMVMTVALFNQYRFELAPVLSQLSYCLIGGEAVDANAAMAVLTDTPPKRLINIYGPSETTVFVVAHDITLQDSSSVPIGKPVSNTQVHVVDALGKPVPTGVVGEIIIEGAQVGRGYLNRKELSDQKFNPNPTRTHRNRTYRTGDLGRWRADGVLEFVGRVDDQVKIRGFRIEPSEVEYTLKQNPNVKDSAVLVQANTAGEPQLVAYVVAANSPNQESSQQNWLTNLKKYALGHLPHYLQPALWVPLDQMPLTSNGKLDRRALSAPEQPQVLATFVEPEGELETLLAQAWKAVLPLQDNQAIGRLDNFFALGGHSLLAVKASEFLRQRGFYLPVKAIFNAENLAETALLIQRKHTSSTVNPDTKITQHTTYITPDLLPLVSMNQPQIDALAEQVPGGMENIQDIYPLSALQEGILFQHLMAQTEDPYLLRTVLSFQSRSALDSFTLALEQVIQKHDILRTSIHWDQGAIQLNQPVQVVQKKASLKVIESTQTLSGSPEAEMAQLLEQQRSLFDLRRGPLLLGVAAGCSDGRWLMGILGHHVIADNQTLAMVLQEVSLLLTQSAPLLETLPFRYYIAQQVGQPQAAHEAFFKHRLADFSEPAFMFGVHDNEISRKQLQDRRHLIGSDVTAQVREQARHYKISVASLLHLAWGVVVSACSGQEDVVFGSVLSGRTQAGDGADRALGLFINTLPVRLKLAGVQVIDAAQWMHRELLELTEHEQAPLALARRCSSVPADAPLFNVLFNCRHKLDQEEEAVVEALAGQGVAVVSMEERTHYPVTFCVDEQADTIQLSVQTALAIDPDRVLVYYVTALQNLLTALSEKPTASLCSIDVLPQAEKQQLTKRAQNPPQELPFYYAHERFELLAETHPEAVALKGFSASGCATYRGLNNRANQIAHYLIKQGTRPGDRVALCLERGVDLVAACIGVLKAGAAYVPLDPAHTSVRLEFSLLDCLPSLLVTSNAFAQRFEQLKMPTLYVDLLSTLKEREIIPNPAVPGLEANSAAYLIYTSGSTGQPKGVVVEHQQLSQLLNSTEGLFEFRPSDVWAQFHSCAFDFSVWEIWGALTTGATLLLVPDRMSRLSDEFYGLVCAENVTVLNQTPAALRALLSAQQHSTQSHALRYLILGGEALEPHVIADWQRINHRLGNNHCRLINMYGITEITVHGTFCDVTHFNPKHDTGLMGAPLPGTDFYLLDSLKRPVPVGVVGEIYVAGAQVARGYWQRETLNNERFIEHGFEHENTLRLYRSGDLAYWHSDGTLSYVGRNDNQISIRGYRIEKGEIEAQLREFPYINDAVVVARKSGNDVRLLAYVVADNPIDQAHLRQNLLRVLPEYLVPSLFITVPALPLTVNGKLDQAALPAPATNNLHDSCVPPTSETEQQLATMWEALLEVKVASRDDHFFSLGGHSLLVVRLNNAIKRHWNISLPLRTLYELATVAKLAAVIDVARGESLDIPEDEEYEEGIFE